MLRKTATVLLACTLMAIPASARAASTSSRDARIYRDCQDDGWLAGHYTKAQLRHAIKVMPADVAEYSDCEARLKRVLHHGGDGRLAGHGGVKAALRDCASDGRLDRRWSVSTLKRALKTTHSKKCRAVIRAELRKRT
jgi:hypothetical protein